MKVRFTDAKFAKETDKAVAFSVVIDYEFNASSSLSRNIKKNALIWIPKSQLDADGNPAEWIWKKNVEKAARDLNPFKVDYGWAFGIKNIENPDLKPFKTEKELKAIAQKQQNFENAGDFREALVKELKSKGAKGVHSKMKNKTLFEKADEFGVDAQKLAEKFNYTPKKKVYNYETGEYELKEVFKKLAPVKPSTAIKKDFETKLKLFTQKINNSVKRWTLARLNKDKGTPAKQLIFELNSLQAEWDKKASILGKSYANSFNKQISTYVDLSLQKQLKDTLLKDKPLLNLIKTDKTTDALMRAYERNLYLIKSIPTDIIDRYRQGFLSASESFDREKFAKLAVEYGEVSKRRAKFIARDQTAKAISSYNQARAESLGFKYFVWQTSKDERVSTGKGGHAQLDGRIFAYDNPTAVIDSYGHTGGVGVRPNCRCTAIPIIPSFTQELKKVKDSQNGDYFILVEKK